MSSNPNFTAWRDLEDQRRIYRDMADAAAYHWKLDEGQGTTVTCEVTGEVGTINGASWTADNEWVGGYGLQFDQGDWIDFDIASLGGGEDFMWVSVAFEDGEPNSRGVLAGVVDTADADRWNLESGSYNEDGSIYWYMAGADDSLLSDPGSITANTKHHALGIHDNINDYRELHFNGASVDTGDADGDVPGGEPTTFRVGRRGAGSREFVGVIGEVMIGFTELDDEDKRLLYERQPYSV